MILELVSGIEDTFAQLAFDLIVVSFHVRLQMILRGDLFVAHLASVDGNLNTVESAVARQQLLVNEAHSAVLEGALVRFV